MSFLYISKFKDDNGLDRFGLFYDDYNGKRCPHVENWKHVVFDTEEESQEKLRLITEERGKMKLKHFHWKKHRSLWRVIVGNLLQHMQRQLHMSIL